MSDEISLETVNQEVLALVQALLGSISPNFRVVMLEYKNEIWRLIFILEQDKADDREEIVVDITTAFEACHEKGVEYEVAIEITDKDIYLPKQTLTRRFVYCRKEY